MWAIVAIVLMMVVAITPAFSDGDSDAADSYFKYTLTNGSRTAITVTAENAPLKDFDSNGYGPFNSFYAAFDSTNNNKMICHLNPNNLKQAITKTIVSGYESYFTAVDGTYSTMNTTLLGNANIMWCLPTIYWYVENGSLVLTNEPLEKASAYAHTINSKSTPYNYLAIGVYEAYNNSNLLMSKTGVSPTANTTLANFRTYANAVTINTDGKGVNGDAGLWNYYQFQLYRLCALAYAEDYNVQSTIGWGNAMGTSGSSSKTGYWDSSGPAAGNPGTSISAASNNGVKLYIENAWGSLWDYVDDAWWSSGLCAGQNSTGITSNTSGKNQTNITPGIGDYGTKPDSTHADSWGMPTEGGGNGKTGTCDYFYSSRSGYALIVGGNWDNSDAAGVSCLNYSRGAAYDTCGSRLAFVFDADPAATPTVTLDHSNLTAAGGNATGFDTELTITDTATYPDLNTVTSNPSIQAGWTHIGWEVDGVKYDIGASLASTESHTAKSLWAEPKMIIMDHSALSSLGGPVTDLPSTKKIVDATTTYPDLNSEEYAFYVLGFRHTGWYDEEGNFYAIGSPVIQTTSHTVKSAWIVPQITITFMVEGEEYSTLQVPKGSVGVVYTPLMVEGVFEGWYYDAGFTKKYQADKALDGPTTLYAKGVPPLEFTSIPTASATITKVNPYGLFFFDATDSTGKYQIEWDFGDGNTSTDAIAYNTYVEPGVYKVTLKITNLYGDVATETFDVIYGDQPDTADGPVRSIMSVLVVTLVVIVIAGVLIRRVL